MKVVDLGTRLEIQDEDGVVYQRYHASTDDDGKFELSGPNVSLSGGRNAGNGGLVSRMDKW